MKEVIKDSLKNMATLIHVICTEYYMTPILLPILSEKSKLSLDVLKMAANNNVLVALVLSLEKNKKLLELEGNLIEIIDGIASMVNRYNTLIRHTLTILDSTLGTEYMLFKISRFIPRLHDDLDILVVNFKEAINSLKKINGVHMVHYFPEIKEAVFEGKWIHRIHVHGMITWSGGRFIDESSIFDNSCFIKWYGHNVRVTDYVDEFCINIAHINYEDLYIDLCDFITLCILAQNIHDVSSVTNKVKEYRWIKTFYSTINILSSLHKKIFGEGSSPFLKFASKHDHRYSKLKHSRMPFFPVELPRTHIVKAFIEKHLITHILKRWLKAGIILLTGSTFKHGKGSPERIMLMQVLKTYSNAL